MSERYTPRMFTTYGVCPPLDGPQRTAETSQRPSSGAEAQWPHGCYRVSRRELARAALRVLEVGPLIESGYSTTMLFPWRRRPRRRPARDARLLRQGIARETTRDHILRQQPEARVHPRGVAHEQVE